MKNLNTIKLAMVDIESTGLNIDQHEIIELAALVYDQESQQIVQEWETKIAPSHIETADPQALKINKYAENPGAYTTSLNSALIKFNSVVRDCICVGQSIHFDLSFIEKAMRENNIKPLYHRRHIDTMSLFWFTALKNNMSNISLQDICNHYSVSNVGAHSALADCRRTFEIYKRLEMASK